MQKLEHKFATFNIKTTDDGRGEFHGCANFCGFLDDGGDIIPEGGFNEVLKSFLKSGFIAHSHEWNIKDGVIGYPVEAHEDEDGLFIRAKYHSTQDAQDIRTKMQERVNDGLEVGLSIGYRGGKPIFIYPKDYQKELPKYLKPEFLQLGLKKAERFKSIRVLPKLSELKEVSVVTSPMNTLSGVDGVKSMSEPKFAPVETPWDAEAADARLREWSEKQLNKTAAYDSAFLVIGEKGAANKYMVGDILDDEFVLVPAAFKAVAEEVRTGDAEEAVRISITNWCEKIAQQYNDESFIVDLSGEKIGARNSSSDKVRIKKIHDMAAEMDPESCSGYGTKSHNHDLEEILGKSVREIFESKLGEVEAGNPNPTWTAFAATMEEVKCGCEASDKKPDTNQAMMAAASELSDVLVTAATEKGSDEEEEEDDPKDNVKELSDWKKQKFMTEKLKTAALRQRAGQKSGLSGA